MSNRIATNLWTLFLSFYRREIFRRQFGGRGLDGQAGVKLLEVVDDQLIAGLKAVGHQPLVADREEEKGASLIKI